MRFGARAGRAVAFALLLTAGPAAARFVELPATADVAAYEGMPATLRGANPLLWAVGVTDPSGHDFETFLRFDLPPDLVGPGETVGLALLALTYALDSAPQGSGSDVPGTLECREVLTPWAEDAVSWNARPSYGPPLAVVEGITELGPVLCDLSALVADQAAGLRENHGFALTNPTARLMGFYAREAQVDPGLQPALIVELVPVPEAGRGAAGAAAVLGLAVRARRRRSGGLR